MSLVQKSVLGAILFTVLLTRAGFACEFCTIPQLGKREGAHIVQKDEKVFVKYVFEAIDFDVMDPQQAHELHHDGHHLHNKVKEYVHHLNVGVLAQEDLTFIFNIPYVIRKSLEIDDHDILGSKQTSEGLGDITAAALWRLWQEGNASASAIGGMKLPSGATHEKNSVGTRFEAEFQPGSGSLDYFAGGVYKLTRGAHEVSTNLVYIFKRQGAQDYTFGDILSVSSLWEKTIAEKNASKLKLGIDGNLQYEQKHKDRGERSPDSGGVTLLLGPVMNVDVNDSTSLFASLHFPAYQNLGGVHQEMEYTWTAGGKIAF